MARTHRQFARRLAAIKATESHSMKHRRGNTRFDQPSVSEFVPSRVWGVQYIVCCVCVLNLPFHEHAHVAPRTGHRTHRSTASTTPESITRARTPQHGPCGSSFESPLPFKTPLHAPLPHEASQVWRHARATSWAFPLQASAIFLSAMHCCLSVSLLRSNSLYNTMAEAYSPRVKCMLAVDRA